MARGIALLLLVLLAPLPLEARDTAPVFPRDHLTVQRADGQKIAFDVEVATTQEQTEYGLMFRPSLPPDSGMLFLFSQPQRARFWMKNTLIPLDLLFIRDSGVIARVAPQAKPQDLTLIESGEEVLAVLEIKGGEAQRRGIAAGDRIRHPAFDATAP